MLQLRGLARLEQRLIQQEQATREHRDFEGSALRELKAEAQEIKALATRTNGRVNQHDVEIAVIRRAEEEALKLEAARVKAEEDRRAAKRKEAEDAKNRRVSLKQGLIFSLSGALAGAILLAVIYLSGITG
jgi:hypothetical protein